MLGSMILEGKRSGRVLVSLTPDPQSRPSENLILDVQDALALEKASPSPNEINIRFLEEFIANSVGVPPVEESLGKGVPPDEGKKWYSTKKE